jgi:hypothetical protein
MKHMKFFISYSHKDQEAVDRLHVHLAPLKRDGLVAWYDRNVHAGGNLDEEIARNLADSNAFLAIVSADYLASAYCWDKELAEALRRAEQGTMRVIPIILGPCRWKKTELGKVKALPMDGQPIVDYSNRDHAWLEVTEELDRLIEAGARTKRVPKSASASLRPSADTPVGAVREDGPARKLRVKKKFDELDIAEFREKTFHEIRAIFESEVAALNEHEGVGARLTSIGEDGFTCTVSNRSLGRAAHLTMYSRGGDHGGGGDQLQHSRTRAAQHVQWMVFD